MGLHEPGEISGTYLESCNCDAICPCRTIASAPGGRSTHGICLGALTWMIREGRAGATDLSGLAVAIASSYSDDEAGSPWSWFLYLDERAGDDQRQALEAIFRGQLGGTPLKQFPWAWKPSELLGVRAVPFELDHAPGRGRVSAGSMLRVHIRGPVAGSPPVTCVIPGHHRAGHELVADELRVADPPLEFDLGGTCAYEATFAYSSRG
jgi:hypothetical protein